MPLDFVDQKARAITITAPLTSQPNRFIINNDKFYNDEYDYNEDDDARVVNAVRNWGGWVGGYAILPRHLVSAKELVLEWSPMYPRLHVSHEFRLHVSGK